MNAKRPATTRDSNDIATNPVKSHPIMPPTPNNNMNHQCPICKAGFLDRKAVKAHIGGAKNQASSAIAHQCPLCSQQFCSENAMLQHHQNAPSHNTMFKCDKCEKHCRSKQGLNDHQRALGHNTATRSPVGFIPAGRSKGSGVRLTGGWEVNNNITGQMMNMQLDEDWTVCDKDCGWCGHCAESYDY